MRKCPVCQRSAENSLCDNCGFDDSLNLETYPTLGKYITEAKTVSAARILWEKEHQDEMLCSVCGDRRFLINQATGHISCYRCGAPLTAEQRTLLFPAVTPPKEFKKLPGLHVPPEGCQVVATGYNGDDRCSVMYWKNIVALSVSDYHTVGLRKNGTVAAVGYKTDQACETWDWRDIRLATAASYCTCGVKENGTVVCTGLQPLAYPSVKKWKDLRYLTAGKRCLYGLTKDNTVLTTDPYCKSAEDWQNITAIAAGRDHCAGLQADGTVVLAGKDQLLQQLSVQDWRNITSVAAGDHHVVGLRNDGTVVATGNNQKGQCNVTTWRNIVFIAAGGDVTAGVRADGTVVCTKKDLDVSGWMRIAAVAVADNHIAGLQLSEEQYWAQQSGNL